jgi:uncharacterized membrane-anchored protein YitT (DUF2179 family)
MKKNYQIIFDLLKNIIGSAIFALGFDLFLVPHNMNAGGITGLAMVLVHVLGIGTVGIVTALINVPLFAIGGWKVGKKFFFGSIIGLVFSTVFIDLFTLLPVPEVEPLIATLYGGVLCGCGVGIVFMSGASTGGSDIVVRLIKLKWRNISVGAISMGFDLCVTILTAVVFRDVRLALYSGVTIFVSGKVMDAVVYSFDYSRVALIITKEHEVIAATIAEKLDRGATYLDGEGSYSREPTKVVLTAVKRQQLADLKQLVVEIDPDAFIIVQEAHQVLGDGFTKYSKDGL